MDDWRVTSSLTLNYGVRYEFYAPYSEKYGHLAYVGDQSRMADSRRVTEVTAGTAGYPGSLVAPWRKAFRPSVGIAWRVPKLKQTVVRAGFGMNYTRGRVRDLCNADGAPAAVYQSSRPTRKPAATALRRRARGQCR